MKIWLMKICNVHWNVNIYVQIHQTFVLTSRQPCQLNYKHLHQNWEEMEHSILVKYPQQQGLRCQQNWAGNLHCTKQFHIRPINHHQLSLNSSWWLSGALAPVSPDQSTHWSSLSKLSHLLQHERLISQHVFVTHGW